ncbi:hypothetical protein FI667_g13308, partial [Globisporangium splendens]
MKQRDDSVFSCEEKRDSERWSMESKNHRALDHSEREESVPIEHSEHADSTHFPIRNLLNSSTRQLLPQDLPRCLQYHVCQNLRSSRCRSLVRVGFNGSRLWLQRLHLYLYKVSRYGNDYFGSDYDYDHGYGKEMKKHHGHCKSYDDYGSYEDYGTYDDYGSYGKKYGGYGNYRGYGDYDSYGKDYYGGRNSYYSY